MIPELQEAVVSRLQSVYRWGKMDCCVTELGIPNPMAGEVFVSIHDGPVSQDSSLGDALALRVGLNITISRHWPQHRQEFPMSTVPSNDIRRIALKIMQVMMRDRYQILNLANKTMNPPTSPEAEWKIKFQEPLAFVNAGAPEPKTETWWGRDPGETGYVSGWSMTLAYDRSLMVISPAEPNEERF